MRYLAVLLIVAATSTPNAAHVGAHGFATEDVSFPSAGMTLHGTILTPPGLQTGAPGMVLVHGSGTGVSRNSLRPVAEAFAARGVVTLIYDKRAEGYSPSHRDFSLLADDALAAVSALRARSYIDPRKVGLWGFSEGGWVAPIAAARSANVAFLVVVGANGIPPARQQAWADGEQLRHEGVTSGGQLDFAMTMTRFLADADLFAQANYDPLPVLEQVRQPVLGVWGGRDRATPPGEGISVYQQVLARSGNPHYTLRVFAEGDHAIHRAAGDGFQRTAEILPGYPELVTAWVTAVTSGNPPPSSVDPTPLQERQSREIEPLASGVHLAAIALFTIAFLSYPISALWRRRRIAGPRWLAGTGIAATLGWVVYLGLMISRGPLGPTVAGRSMSWLVLQLLAIGVLASAIATALKWRTDRVRLSVLLLGAAIFIVWAFSWGLLSP